MRWIEIAMEVDGEAAKAVAEVLQRLCGVDGLATKVRFYVYAPNNLC